jgi:BolA protein
MAMADIIRDKLIVALKAQALEVRDESALHHGHSGARPDGETHFNVHIVSETFEGLSRVERQRLVYGALAGEMKAQIHALTLTTLTPDEAQEAGPTFTV